MNATKVTHTGLHKYSIPGKRASDALTDDEKDLYELAQHSGIQLSPAVFRILHDLLKHNVSPVAIAQVLKSMVRTKSPNSTTFTLIPDSSRSTVGSSSRGPMNSTSGLTTSASSRKGTTGNSSSGMSSYGSGSSSARSMSSVPDSARKGSRVGSGSSRSGRSGSARDPAAGQRQPKS
ncbi:uncharacterized protein [Amphiura filiformis]|uniref:uncharacterized protein n=1 Tax=Amphiura filiformis TaxID=82378 RepID=UPI003B21EC27